MKLAVALNLSLAATAFAAITNYTVQKPPLDTPWTYSVGTNPWTEYPRPQKARSTWQNLNGIWKWQNATSLDSVNQIPAPNSYTNEVLVPSCLESGLSGLQGTDLLYNWLATEFSVPSNWTVGNRVLLNFGAVDYEATVFVDGQKAGFHRGGYVGFEIDITAQLSSNSTTHELTVFVHDPTDSGDYIIPIGKQTLDQSHIFYTPCSGIWQNVWIESAPSSYINVLNVSGDMNGTLSLNITAISATNGTLSSEVDIEVFSRKSNSVVGTFKANVSAESTFQISKPDLWSFDSPNLYDITVKYGKDVVKSYTGFRSITKGTVNGITRPLLNGEFAFSFGLLDQGYWPDGIYTPPNKEAMIFDIKTAKDLGFNMLRKHMKTETPLWYQACDEMGVLVIQDMPSMRPLQSKTLSNCTSEPYLPDPDQQTEFVRQLAELVNYHKSFTCIITWVIYNEGWGQLIDGYPEFALTDLVHSLDPTRLIDSTSGWFNHGAGDFSDNHHYANPQCGTPFYSIQSSPYDPNRIGFQGEFGGLGNNVSIDHLWNVPAAIAAINQTYELDTTVDAWNYRAHTLLGELREQTELFACSGAIWTQVVDVEGEVNGLSTYDRRVFRPNADQWKKDIQALYDTAAKRANASMPALM